MIGRPWNSIAFSSLFLLISLFGKLPQYDVIYARDYHTAIIALLPRLLFHKKLIYEINGLASEEQKLKSQSVFNQVISFFIRKAENMATQFSDQIICVTPQIANYLVQHFHCQPDKVKVISNGVNTKKFFPITDKHLLKQFRDRLNIGEGEILIVFIGNLAPWQGIEYLIRVAPLLLKEKKNVRFLIVGEGIWKDKLEMSVKKIGLSDHFTFTGMVDHEQIPLYINIADICVLPKRKLKSGYSPIKLYEYMACGKPIVSSQAEGLEFIEEEGIGRVIDPEDTACFKDALEDLIEDQKKRDAMSERALFTARDRFDWEIKVIEIEKILKDLLA
ncbi:MAG: glycosyltransferase family 4 protein [Deltaproteobacteria bacterium]|nr:glycosyltransferase family 4 protein [Deltaproteobacteria bacterium]